MTADARHTVICLACGLPQFERERCRRCSRALPKPEARIVVQDLTFGPTAPVLPLNELVRRSVLHALRKSANVTEAAERLGVGKTTMYRMLRRFCIRTHRGEYVPAGHSITAGGDLPPEQNYLFLED